MSQLQFNLVPERRVFSVSELTGESGTCLTATSPTSGLIANSPTASTSIRPHVLHPERRPRPDQMRLLQDPAARHEVPPRRWLARHRARLHQRLRIARRIPDLHRKHRARRPGRAATRFRPAEEAPRRRRPVCRRAQEAAAHAPALHRPDHLAHSEPPSATWCASCGGVFPTCI